MVDKEAENRQSGEVLQLQAANIAYLDKSIDWPSPTDHNTPVLWRSGIRTSTANQVRVRPFRQETHLIQ